MAKLRRIRKWGNSWVVILAPTDAQDNDIVDKGWLDIEDAIFLTDRPTLEQIQADENITKICKGMKNSN